MGIFWDIIQQGQIHEQNNRANSLEGRVAYLESELKRTQELLDRTLRVLEETVGKDINGDGRLG